QEPANSASARSAGGSSLASGASVDRAARTGRSEERLSETVDGGGKEEHRSDAGSGGVGTAAPSAVPTLARSSEAVCFKVVLCLAKHLALVAVCKLACGVGERHPESSLDFDPHVGVEVVDFSGEIAHQVETHNLENTFAIAPGADVDILVIREFGDRSGHDASFFQHFPHGSCLRFFARVHQTLGEG